MISMLRSEKSPPSVVYEVLHGGFRDFWFLTVSVFGVDDFLDGFRRFLVNFHSSNVGLVGSSPTRSLKARILFAWQSFGSPVYYPLPLEIW